MQDAQAQLDKGFARDNKTNLRDDKLAGVSGNEMKNEKLGSIVRSRSPSLKLCGAEIDKSVSDRRSRSISSDSKRGGSSSNAVVVVQDCSAKKKENPNKTGDGNVSKTLAVSDDEHTRTTDKPAAGDENKQAINTENMKLESTKEIGISEQGNNESDSKKSQGSVKSVEKDNVVKLTDEVIGKLNFFR